MKNMLSSRLLLASLSAVYLALLAPVLTDANLYSNEHPTHSDITNANIRRAVIEYVEDQNYATLKYGVIEDWDTAGVTDMSFLFFYGRCPENEFQEACVNSLKSFDADISSWDTSGVTSMDSMFFNCENFNRDVAHWNVRNVKNIDRMFYNARAFNANVGRWDVSSVTQMDHTFKGAEAFSHDLTHWNIG
eukprot:CAMPEP_0194354086 /NCGR_PEP_ID=MMETSP0174-20130528/2274_1 /TAXON_ID=216777 /ORGANISM="Proboscia alata, Strain PI-D3" /LENGTH=189 /DNA_ID=CAMNT_0039122855 /DNA_START=24 /DNA_END=593 /DNA_ORIENTATION=+